MGYINGKPTWDDVGCRLKIGVNPTDAPLQTNVRNTAADIAKEIEKNLGFMPARRQGPSGCPSRGLQRTKTTTLPPGAYSLISALQRPTGSRIQASFRVRGIPMTAGLPDGSFNVAGVHVRAGPTAPDRKVWGFFVQPSRIRPAGVS